MKRKHLTSVIILVVFLVMGINVLGEIPKQISYQGLLTEVGGDPVADDTYGITFTIYNSSSLGDIKWTETQNVTTSGGLFSVNLGTIIPIEDTVFNESTRYLGITLAGNPEMVPRVALISVPYANRVATVDGALGGNIIGDVELTDRLGIGATNDSASLYINANIPNQAGIYVRSTENVPSIFALHDGTGHGISIIKMGSSGEALSIIRSDNGRAVEISSAPGEGSEFFVIEGDGRVGIGTNAPSEQLDVSGTVRMDGLMLPTGASNGFVLTSDGEGNGSWQNLNSSSSSFANTFWYEGIVTGLVICFTAPPEDTLYVTGINLYPYPDDGGGSIGFRVDGVGSITLGILNLSWSAGGGAPLRVLPGESFIGSTGTQPQAFRVTVTGFVQ